MSKPTTYRFSFGPWNISEGADPFGPEIDGLTSAQVSKQGAKVKKILNNQGLAPMSANIEHLLGMPAINQQAKR